MAKHSTRKEIAGDALIQEHIQLTSSTRMHGGRRKFVKAPAERTHTYTDHGITAHALNTS